MKDVLVSEIQIIPIKPQSGLVAFASCVINNQFYIGNIAIYTAPNLKLGYRLVFPNKKLVSGKVIDCFHPISKEAQEAVSSAIVRGYTELIAKLYCVE